MIRTIQGLTAVLGRVMLEQMIQFMENLSMMGAMVLLIANGSGPMSLDTMFPRKEGATS